MKCKKEKLSVSGWTKDAVALFGLPDVIRKNDDRRYLPEKNFIVSCLPLEHENSETKKKKIEMTKKYENAERKWVGTAMKRWTYFQPVTISIDFTKKPLVACILLTARVYPIRMDQYDIWTATLGFFSLFFLFSFWLNRIFHFQFFYFEKKKKSILQWIIQIKKWFRQLNLNWSLSHRFSFVPRVLSPHLIKLWFIRSTSCKERVWRPGS